MVRALRRKASFANAIAYAGVRWDSSARIVVGAVAFSLIVAGETFNALTGHDLDCGCGLLWYGVAEGPLTSRVPFDWYTLSHVIHRLLFYWAAWLLLGRRSPAAPRFLIAVMAESGGR